MSYNPFLLKALGFNQEGPGGEMPVTGTVDFLGRAATLAPLGVGVAIGFNNMRGNTAIRPESSGIRGHSQTVGDNISRLSGLREAAKARSMEKVKNVILSDGNLENTLREASEKRTALLSSLLSVIEESTDVDSLRDKLKSAISNEGALIDEDISSIKRSISTIFEQGGEIADAFHANHARFEGIANQIVTPTDSLKGLFPGFNDGFSDFDSAFKSTGAGANARKIHNRIKSTLGAGAHVSYRTVQEVGGGRAGRSLYMNVSYGGRSSIPIPLHLAELSQNVGNKSVSAPIVRFGQDQATPYLGRQAYVSGPSLKRNYLDQGKVLTSDALNKQMNYRGNRSTGTAMSFTDWFSRQVVEQLESTGGQLSRAQMQHLNEIGRAGVVGLDRNVLASMDPHLVTQHLNDASSALIFDLEKINARNRGSISALAHSGAGSALVAGASSEIERLEAIGFKTKQFGQSSLMMNTGKVTSNAAFNLVRNYGLESSMGGLLEATARVRQMIGRKERFVQPNEGFGISKIPSTLGSGSIKSFGQNLGFARGVTGVNTGVLMDLSSGNARLGLSEGMAYWGMSPSVQTSINKTVIDSNSIGREGHALMEELKAKGELKISGKKQLDAFFKKYSGTKGGGAILGLLDTGFAEISRYSDLQSLNLRINEMTDSMGRSRYHIGGEMTRGGVPSKVFSMGAKATIAQQGLTQDMFTNLIGRMGVNASDMAKMGLSHNNLMINTGDMMKKSAWYLGQQMITAASIVGGKDINQVYKAAESHYAGAGGGAWKTDSMIRGQRRGYLSSTASFLADQLASSKGATNQSIGMAFGGIYAAAEQGWHDLDKTTVDQLDSIIKSKFGGERSAEIVAQARKHVAVGAFTMVAGTPASEYRATMGSMEPRFYQFLSHRLKNVLGFGDKETADFMTTIMARKVGVEGQLEGYKALSRSVESMGSAQALFTKDFAHELRSTGQVVDVNRFINEVSGDDESARKFLSKFDKGFLLDFSDESANQHLRGTAMSQFGGREQIYIPGANLMDLSQDLEILQKGENLRIRDEYTRRVADLSSDLATITSGQGMGRQELAEAQARVGNFREATAQIWAQTGRSLTRGKLLGSSFLQGAGIVLTGEGKTAGIGKRMEGLRGAFMQSGMSSTFADGQAFLDSMRGYTGAAQKGIEATEGLEGAARRAQRETTSMFQSFFLGMEGKRGWTEGAAERVFKSKDRYQGAEAILSRHPLLGTGHVSFSKVFRYDYGDQDTIFKSFTQNTDEGSKALQRIEKAYGRKITSFKDFADAASAEAKLSGKGRRAAKSARMGFFSSMSSNIGKYAGEGGGRIHLPDMNIDVHYTSGDKHKFNFGKAAMMVGDFDGDMYQLFMKSDRRHAISQGKNLDKMLSSTVEDLAFTAKTNQYFAEAKSGLAALEGGKRNLTVLESIFEGSMKEYYAKQIGPLNVSLDHVRLGMINSIENAQDTRMAQRGIALLEAVQEVANIKGKKLTMAMDLPRMLNVAVQQGIESGGQDISAFRNLIENGIFKDSNIVSGKKLMFADIAGDLERAGVPVKMRGELADAMEKAGAETLDDLFGFMSKSFASVKSLGIDQMGTLSRDTLVGMGDTRERRAAYLHQVNNAHSIQGAFARGNAQGVEEARRFASDIGRTLERTSSSFSGRALGPIAIGAAATMALGVAMGDKGYADRPLIMPGEISDQRVNDAIAAGSFGGDAHIPPETLHSGGNNDIINRPINMQEAYFSKGNAWQIRGGAVSRKGLSDMSNLISSMGGSTSVRVNDTRRPLSRDYINRMMGD